MDSSNIDILTALACSIYINSKHLSKKKAMTKLKELRSVLMKYPKYYTTIPSALQIAEKSLKEIRGGMFLNENRGC